MLAVHPKTPSSPRLATAPSLPINPVSPAPRYGFDIYKHINTQQNSRSDKKKGNKTRRPCLLSLSTVFQVPLLAWGKRGVSSQKGKSASHPQVMWMRPAPAGESSLSRVLWCTELMPQQKDSL